MFCKKCSREIKDLSKYCGFCGAQQFGLPDEKIVIYRKTDCKVVLDEIENRTVAMTGIQRITGYTIVEIQQLLKQLPAIIVDDLTEEEANTTVAMLEEQGIHARVEKPEEISVDDIPHYESKETQEEVKDPEEINLVLHPTPESDREFMLEVADYMDEKEKDS